MVRNTSAVPVGSVSPPLTGGQALPAPAGPWRAPGLVQPGIQHLRRRVPLVETCLRRGALRLLLLGTFIHQGALWLLSQPPVVPRHSPAATSHYAPATAPPPRHPPQPRLHAASTASAVPPTSPHCPAVSAAAAII